MRKAKRIPNCECGIFADETDCFCGACGRPNPNFKASVFREARGRTIEEERKRCGPKKHRFIASGTEATDHMNYCPDCGVNVRVLESTPCTTCQSLIPRNCYCWECGKLNPNFDPKAFERWKGRTIEVERQHTCPVHHDSAGTNFCALCGIRISLHS